MKGSLADSPTPAWCAHIPRKSRTLLLSSVRASLSCKEQPLTFSLFFPTFSTHLQAVTPFVARMDELYLASDLVVARAGAITCSELMATGAAEALHFHRSPR